MKIKKLPTLNRLKELFSYNHTTGIFIRKISCNRVPKGNVTGSDAASGHLTMAVDGISYLCHRIAWKYVYGSDPEGCIDHINGDGSDNRICNLRIANKSQNACNSKLRSDNASGFKGVHFDKKNNMWMATIEMNGKSTYLGRSKNIDAANIMATEARKTLHKEFYNSGLRL